MPYIIPSSPKIPNLVTSLFLFILVGVIILVGVLCLSVNLLWCQECTFCCPIRKKRCILLPEATDVHQKDLNLCLPLYYYGKVIVELEKKHKEGI